MITAIITKIEKKNSKFGGYFYYIFFKSSKNYSYFSCIYPKFKNWSRWKKVMKKGITLSNLRLVEGKKNLINADSNFKVEK